MSQTQRRVTGEHESRAPAPADLIAVVEGRVVLSLEHVRLTAQALHVGKGAEDACKVCELRVDI